MNVGPPRLLLMTSESGSSSTARFSFGELALVLTDVRQRIIGEPLMRGRVVRIQLQSPFRFSLIAPG